MRKPILFLDFDRTLFDTARLYQWLGGNAETILLNEKITGPNFASMLYPDVLPFLKAVRCTHRVVLLTSTANSPVQEKKVYGSGITPYLDDTMMVKGVKGDYSGKGPAIMQYLRKIGHAAGRSVFVDDLPQSISEVKALNGEVRCVRINRKGQGGEIEKKDLTPPDDVVATLPELHTLLQNMPPHKKKIRYHQ